MTVPFPSEPMPALEGGRWVQALHGLDVTLTAADDRTVSVLAEGGEFFPDQVRLIESMGGDVPSWGPYLARLDAWSRHGVGISAQEGLEHAAAGLLAGCAKASDQRWWPVLVQDPSPSVRAALADALPRGADVDLFTTLAHDADSFVTSSLVRNPALPRDLLEWLSWHGPAATLEQILVLHSDALAVTNAAQRLGVRALDGFARRPADTISVSMWQGLARQGHDLLRAAVVDHEDVPTLVLRLVANGDRNRKLRSDAARLLAARVQRSRDLMATTERLTRRSRSNLA